MTNVPLSNLPAASLPGEIACTYHVLRYSPNLVRDEWVNIGILLFNSVTGERRLRLIEDEEEYRRVRRLHPQADETVLRALRDDLEERLQSAETLPGPGDLHSGNGGGYWQQVLAKWDNTLSNALQLASQKGVYATDLDVELERLYADHVAVQYSPAWARRSRARVPPIARRSSARAHLWERVENPCGVENGPFRVTRCASITATAAMARAVSCPIRHARPAISNSFPLPSASTREKLKGICRRYRRRSSPATSVTFSYRALYEVGIEPVAMEGLRCGSPN
jgi:hypothetical protein